ncbi:MAG: hypothetical protein RL199_1352 [Pseudomonadota bacterium]|jgi:parvulin-like peptidyl-prolyl isomerase
MLLVEPASSDDVQFFDRSDAGPGSTPRRSDAGARTRVTDMLDTFRENARSWTIQTLIGAIALVFIFSFGPGSRGCRVEEGPASWAAKVNGETVPASAFDQSLRQAVYLRQLMNRGGQYTRDDARRDKVREQAMKDTVDRELVHQAALEAGLWVSDEDVVAEVMKNEQFKKSGAFDVSTYRRYVENAEGLTTDRYEERVRRGLLVQRMSELVTGSVTVSDDELKAEFIKGEEAATIEYVKFGAGAFREPAAVSDVDAQAYLAGHEADVKKKFEESKFLYMEPRGLKARRLFVPVKADAAEDAQAAAKKAADDAKGSLDAGKGWEEVSGALAAAGGRSEELGWVSLGRSAYGRTLEEAVFKVKKGEKSGIVQDNFGFSIVEVQDERPAAEKSFDEAKLQVAKELAGEGKAKELAKAGAEKAFAALKAGTSLAAQFPKAEGDDKPAGKLEAKVTDEFHPAGGVIPGAGLAPKVSAAAFALTADNRLPAGVVEDGGAFWVFQLQSRRRADLAGFDGQKDTLRERLKSTKQSEVRTKWLEGLRSKAAIRENKELLSYENLRQGVSPSDG